MAQPQLPQVLASAPAAPRLLRLAFDIEETPGRWLLDEETMPESPLHDSILDLLKLILLAWAARTGRDALIARNFACRWDPDDARVGLDPDLCLIEPAPPRDAAGLDVTQLHTWEPGHAPPRLGIEIVSPTTAAKDYEDAAARYARLGTREVWIFDPLLQGPSSTGGPFVVQVWRQQEGMMQRVHAGSGPAWSEELGAWLVVTGGGHRLRIADDRDGQQLWPTPDEFEHAALQQSEQARAEAERASLVQAARAEAAEAELAALRRQLAALTPRSPGDS
jgi:Uma2 family endonuclease